MSVFENVDWPIIVAAGVLGLALLYFLFSGVRTGRQQRSSAEVIAAVQAERDVLRANHAVEIATLETKIAETQDQLQREMDASLRLKEMQKAIEERDAALATQAGAIAGLEKALGEATDKTSRVARDLEEQQSLSRDVPKLKSERDQARQTADGMANEISELRAELREAKDELIKARAERGDANAGIVAERDEQNARADREAMRAQRLEGELEALRTATGALEDGENLAQSVIQLKGAVKSREATIQELRDALAKAQDGGDDESAQAALDAAKSREAHAHEALSKLAYDRDGLLERLNAAERTEREARAEVEKREALLELRLQKIYELEARLRDQHGQIHAALRRAETAEDRLTASGDSADYGDAVVVDTEAEARLAELEEEMTALRHKADELDVSHAALKERHDTLLAENEALRQASPDVAEDTIRAISSAELQIAELKAEVERLRAAPPVAAVGPKEVEELKAALRDLGERFVAEASVSADPAEASLAERIRVFKAQRDAAVRRPLRIAGPPG
ncbi:MAG: hypothetical protein AAGF45_02690 [Pseudomonadota bacterium]